MPQNPEEPMPQNPGRADATTGVPPGTRSTNKQEFDYRFIANQIAELGYTEFVAHESRPGPGRDPGESLETVLEILNV